MGLEHLNIINLSILPNIIKMLEKASMIMEKPLVKI